MKKYLSSKRDFRCVKAYVRKGGLAKMVACVFLFIIIMCMVIGANSSGCGIKCYSYSCRHNKGGKCRRKEIVVYDNTVTGLCLNHTDNMNNRVIKPMEYWFIIVPNWCYKKMANVC